MPNRNRVILGTPLAALIFICGCVTTPRNSNLEANKQLVRRMNEEVWQKGNLDVIAELYSTNAVKRFLDDGFEVRGIESLREGVRRHRSSFSDWHEEIVHLVAEDDLVVIHFVSTGTNDGTWRGHPPTGRRIRIHEIAIIRVENGRIVEEWILPDVHGLHEQLGASGSVESESPTNRVTE